MKIGTLSCYTYNSENCSRKTYTDCSEMQQLPDIEKTDSREQLSLLKWTICNGRIKVCVNFQTNTDKLNIVAYRYRNSLYLKSNEVGLKMTVYQSPLAKRVCLLSHVDIFYKRRIVLKETTFHN